MTPDDARDVVRRVLREVAPEADLDHVGPDVTLQESIGLDSLDFLNFVAGLHHHTGVEVVERDYPQLVTIDGCVSYLVSATDGGDVDVPSAGRRPVGEGRCDRADRAT